MEPKALSFKAICNVIPFMGLGCLHELLVLSVSVLL